MAPRESISWGRHETLFDQGKGVVTSVCVSPHNAFWSPETREPGPRGRVGSDGVPWRAGRSHRKC